MPPYNADDMLSQAVELSSTDGTVACDPAQRPATVTNGASFSSENYGSGNYTNNSICEYRLETDGTVGLHSLSVHVYYHVRIL